MDMRHGVLVSKSGATAVVTLDGVDVTVSAATTAVLNVGATAVCLQEGQRIVAIGTISEPV